MQTINATCKEIGHSFTAYGVPQPKDGTKLEMCSRCRMPEIVSKPDKNVRSKKYVPPKIEGEAVSMFDLADIPMTAEGQRRAEKKAQRKARKSTTG